MIRDLLRDKLRSVKQLADRMMNGEPAPVPVATPVAAGSTRRREPAPVVLYVEWDSPGRDEVVALLTRHQIPFKVLAIDRDEATKAFVKQTARRAPPVLFIAADVVGWCDELRALEASGELHKRVFGA